MRKFVRRLAYLFLGLAILTAVGALWKRDDLRRLIAVNTLFAEDRIVGNFSNMERLFHTRRMSGRPSGDQPSPLPHGTPARMPEGFDAWVEDQRVTGIVVLQGGQIVHEDYRLGTAPEDLRMSWSVAKSALSILIGILHEDGTLPDLDATVDSIVPPLAFSAYRGATIRNVLNMASGVAFNEDYLDFNSDINRMGRILALGGSMNGFAAGQTTRRGPPGADWLYVSIDTHVLGMVIEFRTGRSVIDLMEERLFVPLGLERDPVFVTDNHGVPFVLGGLNLTTRDYARLGQMVAQGGQWQGRLIVSSDWIAQSTAPTAPGGALYGYQWWLPPDPVPGEFYARGVYGQFLWIDQNRNVVIAVNSANRRFREPGVLEASLEMFRAIAAGVAG
jgi:CubicO group peptidase (beta-lactamase class C family)